MEALHPTASHTGHGRAKTVAITGANGFLGRALTEALLARGYAVLPLTRPNFQLERAGEWQFEEVPDVVIHAAWDGARSLSRARHINVGGTHALRRLCEELGVKQFIFISSMAAHEEARSVYGRTKLEAEMVLSPEKDCIVKSGIMIGQGGLFTRVKRLIETMPVIPVFFDGKAALQVVYIDDLCQAIVQAVEGNASGVFPIAHEKPISIRELYRGIADAANRRMPLLPLPGGLLLPELRLFEMLGLRLPITADTLLGLKHGKVFDTYLACKALFSKPLSFEQSLKKLKA
ncbi:NAD(P)-dependent oxidoreductase [Candidatus Parcubacteria bacterium]|nr:NAD(P)-dependent oxidoreductase [Candidatus Parcubacteria bacterium]